MITQSPKRYLIILTVALIHIFPQISEAKEHWDITVHGAGQLRGNIWSTFYSPDFDPSYYFIDLAASREIYHLSTSDSNRVIDFGCDAPQASWTFTKATTQGRSADRDEYEKEDLLKQYLLSVSMRTSFSSKDMLGGEAPENFIEFDAAANFRLPWGWYPHSSWGVATRLMASAGVLHGSGETGLVASFIPLVAFGSKDGRFTFDLGVGAALLSRQRFGKQDYGGLFQFGLTSGVSVPLYKRLGLGYRFLHYSDAGIYKGENSGADLHMLEVIYWY